MKKNLTEEQRKEIGRKLAEARAKAKVRKEEEKIVYSKRILSIPELRDELSKSDKDFEHTIVDLFNTRKANFQSLEEVTDMTYLELREILTKIGGYKFLDGF